MTTKATTSEGRRAINVADLLYPDMKVAIEFMLGPVTKTRQHRRMNDQQLDSDAVILECSAEQADVIVEFMRMAARRHGRRLRSYVEGPRGGWREVR